MRTRSLKQPVPQVRLCRCLRRWLVYMPAVLLAVALASCTITRQPAADYRFDNGLWFNGEHFEARNAYVVEGQLQYSEELLPATEIVDLGGQYVVPPYCEAHNHNFGGGAEADSVRKTVNAYLKDGIFYAMMMGSFAYYRERIADQLNSPTSVDVVFANNGLTGSGGHPRRLREWLMEQYDRYPEYTEETLPDAGYFEADTLEEMREKWSLILAGQPDFIKVMVLYSEEYDLRKDDPAYYGSRGLDPDLLPTLVEWAHAEGLRIAVHVETDFDMRVSLEAGADIIAHIPSNSNPEILSDETIALAKHAGADLVTTFTVANRYRIRSPERYATTIDAQRTNLPRLIEAGIPVAIGSDNTQGTSRSEAEHLARLGVVDNLTLLHMWTDYCAQVVFPGRNIGRLDQGYEASFLVLEGNPLVDFDNAYRISLRVKDGRLLNLAH